WALIGRGGADSLMLGGIESLTDALKSAHAFGLEHAQEFLVDCAQPIRQWRDWRGFFLHGLQETRQLVDDVEERENKPSQGLLARLRALAINATAIVVEIRERAKIKVMLGLQFLFEVLYCAFHGLTGLPEIRIDDIIAAARFRLLSGLALLRAALL